MPQWWDEFKDAWKAVPGDIPRATRETVEAVKEKAKDVYGSLTSKQGGWGGGDVGGDGAGP